MVQKDVSLVIPGRDCEKTLAQCLESVVPLLNGPRLKEIIFVDDGSVDSSAEIASKYSVVVLKGTGSGPGAASARQDHFHRRRRPRRKRQVRPLHPLHPVP